MKPLESLADALARKVYSESSGAYHQSLVLGGNSEDLNIVLMRMYPMLCAYLRQGS